MWFKNLLIYRFTKPFTLTAEEVNTKLAEKCFAPCNSQDVSSYGWAMPLGNQGSEYIHATNGCIMICAQKQDKILPASVVNDVLADKIEEIKEAEDRIPGRKERTELKEEITFSLIPRAFTRTNRVFAYIAPEQGLLVVNSGSHNRAEELLNFLRESLGSLPLIPVKAKNVAQHQMTEWLTQGSAPTGFELGGECELRDKADESAVIRCKNQNLCASEITNHIEAGMFVNKIALRWTGDIEFIVDDQLTIKRLNFGDLIQDKIGDVNTESAAEQFDVDFAIMSAEFAKFIPAVLEAFGGEDLSDIGEVITSAA
ncbi:Recombination-associated protein RdgC [Zhongshania aliphaticivorans]|uniref:Recombination-associated protein RdgC n=1 Tax=Zhongshania aliphaticivorans TaxID=1470434 RepID=A0A5S9NVI5_9GAMM|nr:recombination-associated protein RdgC [Zhongshania aliphaticivorans]CAA0088533.1 Recombination-associated protein RdgC [Zhongshania aliphaticivorans]CAA0094590.1 Recombination-associated protein RdgC [Zhongshania aliphaticivorans]